MRIVTYLFLLFMALTAGLTLYWLYGPSEVLQVHNSPVPVRPTSQKADQLVFLIVNYCKLQAKPGTVRRALVSSTIRVMLPIQTDNGPTTCTQVDAPLLIPKGIVPDTYHVHIDVTYQLNPLRQVTESLDSQDFVVE
jgi:hypothetical protein